MLAKGDLELVAEDDVFKRDVATEIGGGHEDCGSGKRGVEAPGSVAVGRGRDELDRLLPPFTLEHEVIPAAVEDGEGAAAAEMLQDHILNFYRRFVFDSPEPCPAGEAVTALPVI